MSRTVKQRKPPVIRKGQKVPYIKATAEVVQERVEFIARLLVQRLSRTEIHKEVKKQWRLDWRTIDNMYISRAKQFLVKQAAMSPADAKNVGVNVLLEVIRTGKPSERTSAERRLSEIYGYNAPTKIEHLGEGGGPMEFVVRVSEDELPQPK